MANRYINSKVSLFKDHLKSSPSWEKSIIRYPRSTKSESYKVISRGYFVTRVRFCHLLVKSAYVYRHDGAVAVNNDWCINHAEFAALFYCSILDVFSCFPLFFFFFSPLSRAITNRLSSRITTTDKKVVRLMEKI